MNKYLIAVLVAAAIGGAYMIHQRGSRENLLEERAKLQKRRSQLALGGIQTSERAELNRINARLTVIGKALETVA